VVPQGAVRVLLAELVLAVVEGRAAGHHAVERVATENRAVAAEATAVVEMVAMLRRGAREDRMPAGTRRVRPWRRAVRKGTCAAAEVVEVVEVEAAVVAVDEAAGVGVHPLLVQRRRAEAYGRYCLQFFVSIQRKL
jgi:hypothetical protein